MDRSDCGIGMQKRWAKVPLELWCRLLLLVLVQRAFSSLDGNWEMEMFSEVIYIQWLGLRRDSRCTDKDNYFLYCIFVINQPTISELMFFLLLQQHSYCKKSMVFGWACAGRMSSIHYHLLIFYSLYNFNFLFNKSCGPLP